MAMHKPEVIISNESLPAQVEDPLRRINFTGDLLLSGEMLEEIKPDRLETRARIASELSQLPDDFFNLPKHLQPEVGCGNVCRMCSQGASPSITSLTKNGFYDFMAGLKAAAIEKFGADAKPLIAQGKRGTITPFLDNDSFSSNFLVRDQLQVLGADFGCRLAYSTVGYSRKNTQIAQMHREIGQSNLLQHIHRLRVSWTKYPIGAEFNNDSEYILDIANLIDSYRRLYEESKYNQRNVLFFEIRYQPYLEKVPVEEATIDGHHTIKCGPHVFVSKQKNIHPEIIDVSRSDTKTHIELTGGQHSYIKITSDSLREKALDGIPITSWLNQHEALQSKPGTFVEEVLLSKWSNHGGEYYAINPFHDQTKKTFTALHIYPQTDTRAESGYNNATRVVPNLWVKFKKDHYGIERKDTPESASWDDVNEFMSLVGSEARRIAQYDIEFSKHVIREQQELYVRLVKVLQEASFNPKAFFDGWFIKDTGQIINQGRAISLFEGFATLEDDPLTPNDRRNNVRVLANEEKRVWRTAPVPISHRHTRKLVGYKNEGHSINGALDGSPQLGSIIIQKLDPHSLFPDPNYMHEMRTIAGIEVQSISAQAMRDRFLVPGV